LTTILVPLIIVAFYAAIIAISIKGGSDITSVAVIDDAGLFTDSSVANSKLLKVTYLKKRAPGKF
jgi:hypothetical protein